LNGNCVNEGTGNQAFGQDLEGGSWDKTEILGEVRGNDVVPGGANVGGRGKGGSIPLTRLRRPQVEKVKEARFIWPLSRPARKAFTFRKRTSQ